MARVKAFVTATIATLALAATARAADAPASWPPPEFEQPAPPLTELVSGWYLRGDIGYRYNEIGFVESSPPVVSHDYGNVPAASFGLGYKYHWFRTDLTVDYGAQILMHGTTAAAVGQPQYSDRIDVFTALANVYLDLGTWAGFTPYVGGGAGISYFRSRDYVNTAMPVGGSVDAVKTQNFAWAWMAGLSYQVMPNWLIDVGYRYLDLGDAISRGGSPGGASFNETIWKDLSAQEVRFGVRFLFD